MESQEGRNSNLSDASSTKYDIKVGPALWASCAKNRFFFPVPELGRNGVLPGNHGFFSFRHWLLVEPLEWNEIGISGDLSSPLTRNRLSLCRRLLPNGIIVQFFPQSSKKPYFNESSFSFRIGSSLVLLSLRISWSHHFIVVRANARGTILSIACACFFTPLSISPNGLSLL